MVDILNTPTTFLHCKIDYDSSWLIRDLFTETKKESLRNPKSKAIRLKYKYLEYLFC